MKVVGLTGGIGTGKSTVAAILAEQGVAVLDADQVARRIVEPGTEALAQIVEAFGAQILQPDGSLDRAAMRQKISHDREAKQALERITHPAIGAAIVQSLAQLAADGASLAVVEAALMVETGSYRRYPELIVVTTSEALQLQRVLARDGVRDEDARALIASQMPMADKEAVATYVIRNEGTLESLRDETLAVLDRIRSPAP